MPADTVRVLVVEDDEDDYCLVRDLLQTGLGAEVARAATAEQAIEYAPRGYDAFLLDYCLGPRTGLDVLRELRNRDHLAPVIFLTGQGDEQIAVEAMKAGAADYIPKSKLSRPSLIMALRYALTLRQKEAAVQEARRAVHESERRFRALVENSSDILTLVNECGVIQYITPSVHRILGYAPEELIGTDGFALMHADDVPKLRTLLGIVLQAPGAPMRIDHRVRHKEGHYVLLEATGSSRLHDDAVRAIVLNSRDVSDRDRVEKELRESERRLRHLFETANEGIWTIDAEQKTTFVNRKMAAMLGYTPEEIVGRSYFEFLAPARVDRARTGIEKRQNTEILETEFIRRDGSRMWATLNGSPIIDAHGRYTGALAMITDITERRQLQEQLLHAQKIEAVGQLAGGIAHDFNNLLMVIGSYAEIVAGNVSDDKLRHDLEEIRSAVHRGASLTGQLLAFSRKQVLSPRILDLNATVGQFGGVLSRILGEHIKVDIHTEPNLWSINADPVQIEQVIINLAVNARDAMPGGGRLVLETGNVHLDHEYARRHAEVTPGDYVMLALSDSGEGIAPEILPHIFEPFFTTKEHGKGTGLGLSTVYGIVKQSGGFVWAYSEPGKGSAFKIYLPRAEAAPRAGDETRPANESQSGSETILVVEDEEAVRTAAAEYLGLCGYTVLQARHAEEALEIARHHHLDLVITDLVMPGMRGSELARCLGAERPGTRVLFISGYTEATVGEHGLAPETPFLQKPFSLSGLARKIREVLGSCSEMTHSAA